MQSSGARATIALHPVEDSSAYGLVSTDPSGAVLDFTEKTGEAVPGEINAGMYVLERSVLDLIPPGEEVSIERDVFPRLVGEGLHGLRLDGYWMDIGTPERYLEATWDILEQRVETRVQPTAPGMLVGPGAQVADGATVGPRVVLGPGCAGRGGRRGARLGPARRLRRRRGRPGQRLDPLRRGRGRRPRPARRSRGGQRMRECPTSLMLDDVLAIPDHLRDALWRVESARLEPAEAAGLRSAAWAARRSVPTLPPRRSAIALPGRC